MSLLMEALNKAEKAKQKGESAHSPTPVENGGDKLIAAPLPANVQEKMPAQPVEDDALPILTLQEEDTVETEEMDTFQLDLEISPSSDALSTQPESATTKAAQSHHAKPALDQPLKPLPSAMPSPAAPSPSKENDHASYSARTIVLARQEAAGRWGLLPRPIWFSALIVLLVPSMLFFSYQKMKQLTADSYQPMVLSPRESSAPLPAFTPPTPALSPADIPPSAPEKTLEATLNTTVSVHRLAGAPPQPDSDAPPLPTPVAPALQPQTDAIRQVDSPAEDDAPSSPLPLPQPSRRLVISHRSGGQADAPQRMTEAYEALRKGGVDQALRLYRQHLAENPHQPDTLTALAALTLQQGDTEEARVLYQRLLALNPSDPAAQAAMITLQPDGDYSGRISALKLLLSRYPENGALHFQLGNLYAEQHSWQEARASYAMAVTLDQSSSTADYAAADHAFNLAVSLEHLGKNRDALNWYRTALQLAGETLPVTFDRTLAGSRIATLLRLIAETAP